RGLRIQNIVNELSGEKIDVVEWNETVGSYISNALSPAKVQAVLLDDDGAIKTATVVVPDRQLSLAIGKEGQNARLAAKLTGWRIDIKSDSESREEGLDQVIADRAQAAAIKATEDLLAKAERILRSEDDGVEDRLLQAAQALRDGDPMAVEAPEILSGDFKSFEELLAEVADREEGPGIGDATFETEELQGAQQSAAPEWPDLPEEEPALPSEAAFSEEEVAVEPSPLADVSMTTQEELPEVITADMLRARMAERKKFNFADEDFEVPAELLAGYDEEELDEEDLMEEVGKGKTKGKAKGKAKTKAKPQKGKSSKRRWDGGDEEF
ncbi:MAG: hypothetical protein KDD75_10160, partial [Caldilineaceae bacterium]|nr:hypothetical protein [Caldilineaceae bacterium]